jgi:hypothetical protein
VTSLGELSSTLTNAIKQIIIDITDFLTPIIDIIAIGMIVTGALLIALKQEFYGVRLAISGGVALVIVHLVIPLLLGLIP